MAYSIAQYKGDGSNRVFSVPFPYINKSHVQVYVAGVSTSGYTWLTSQSLQLTSAPAKDVIVDIRRSSNRDLRIINFQDAALLNETTLNQDSDQLFYVTQEAYDASPKLLPDGSYSLENRRMASGADPLYQQDLVTKAYVDSFAFPQGSQRGSVERKRFVAGVDFTAGVTTQLTLPFTPVSKNSVIINFDIGAQHSSEFSVNGNVITFTQPIPTFIQAVEVIDIRPVSLGALANYQVQEIHMASGGVSDRTLLPGSKVYNRAQDGISVKDFGAVGNGVADDTVAVQAALNEAANRGGAVVVVPSGTYRLTALLSIGSKTILRSSGGTRFLRDHNGSFLWNTCAANAGLYNGASYIAIEGGVWDCNVVARPDACNALMFGHVRGLKVSDAIFLDVSEAHAMDVNGCRDVVVERCQFLGFKRAVDGSRDFSEAIQLSQTTSFAGMGLNDCTPCLNVLVRDSVFGASGTATTQAWPVGVGDHYAVATVYNENITVARCVFEGQTFAGCRPFKWKRVFIQDNDFKGCARDVHFSNVAAPDNTDANGVKTGIPEAGDYFVFEGNRCSGTLGESIYLQGFAQNTSYTARHTNIFVRKNRFAQAANPTVVCLFLQRVKGVWVEENVFSSTYRAIYGTFVENLHIRRNWIEGTTVEGIMVTEPDATYRGLNLTRDIWINDNRLFGCGRTGIWLEYAADFEISGNRLRNIGIETDGTRDGINIATNSSYGVIERNIIRKAAVGQENRYGVSVSNTSQYVQIGDSNILEGKSGSHAINHVSSFYGTRLYSPNRTAYKITVSDTGVVTVAAIT